MTRYQKIVERYYNIIVKEQTKRNTGILDAIRWRAEYNMITAGLRRPEAIELTLMQSCDKHNDEYSTNGEITFKEREMTPKIRKLMFSTRASEIAKMKSKQNG